MSDDKLASQDSSSSLTAPEIPESQLTRLDPDSILADEADPDGLLGNDSESEVGGGRSSKRTSTVSAIFSTDLDKQPETPDPNSSDNAIFTSPMETPTQRKQAVSEPSSEKIKKLEDQVGDLTNQVTGLNGKLVKSFERMSDLEDDLSESQERVRAMTAKIAELEKEREEHLAALNTGLLVEKAHVSSEMSRMMDRVIEEMAQRGKAESDKKRIEEELDELSSSLFNEANKMVAVERLARARAEEKSRQMEQSLKDTEDIMVEQQKVLVDLQKQVEVALNKKGGDGSESIRSFDSDAVSFDPLKASILARSVSQMTKARNAKITSSPLGADAHLMINIVPYQEFRAFVAHLRKLRRQLSPFYNYPLPSSGKAIEAGASSTQPPSRTSSPEPNQNGVTQPSLVTFAGSNAYNQSYSSPMGTSSPFVAAGVGRHRDYPTLPSNAENLVQLSSQLSLPFIKRVQEEDVDPCLRLDFAPGLNWLTRRQAHSAILEGNLVIEPIFPGGKAAADEEAVSRENAHLPPAVCAMCGIPVVNVPLPGGIAASHMSAEQGGKTSLVPSSIASATTSWASSAANSLREVTGGSVSSGSSGNQILSSKSSRPSLFSSFRRSAGGGRNSTGSIVPTEPESPSGTRAPTPAGDDTEATNIQAAALIPASSLPVPSHIFRISEGATNRYLLCPHHCLVRLRAACEFWQFIRTMERSVVLEGKFAAEEPRLSEPAAVAPVAEAPAVPQKATETDVKKEEPSKETETGLAAPEKPEEAAPAAAKDKDTLVVKGDKGTVAEDKTGADAGEGKAEEKEADSEAKEEAQPKETEESKESDADNKASEAIGSDDEDGFADAISSPFAGKPKNSDDKDVEEDKLDDGEETPLARSVAKLEEQAEKLDSEIKAEPSQEEADDQEEAGSTDGKQVSTTDKPDTLAVKVQAPPPVPRRSAARGSGTTSPAPGSLAPPTLPPRRARSPAVPTAPAAPLTLKKPTLALAGDDTLDWEDKMWTEITKLKEELWKARIGLLTGKAGEA